MTSNRFFDPRGLAALVGLLAACGGEAPRAVTRTVAAPTEVVVTSTLPQTQVTTGTVRSATVSPLASKVMGNVTRVLVTEGQRVRRGDLLLEIDDREGRARAAQASAGQTEADDASSGADAAVTAAEANAQLAAATLQRFEALRARGSVSPQEFDEVRARSEGAAAQLIQARRMRDASRSRRAQAGAVQSLAQTSLSDTQVRSPIDGIVTARMVDPGAQAVPGVPLLTVEDDARYRVETTIGEELAARVRAGDRVTVEGIQAQVTSVVPVLDPSTRSALVKIDLPRGTGLSSGAFVHVAFPIGNRPAVTLPAAAIHRRGPLTSVFVVGVDGIARMRLVSLGETQGARVEALAGVDPGETIVSRPTRGVEDGIRIGGGAS